MSPKRLEGFHHSKPIWLAAGLIPLLIYAAVMLFWFVRQQHEAVTQIIDRSGNNAAHIVERSIAEQIGILNGLAASNFLDNGNFTGFRPDAERVWQMHPEWRTLILTNRHKPVFNVFFKSDQAILPLRDPESLERVWNTQETYIGDLVNGYTALRVPVIRNKRVIFTMVAPVSPGFFRNHLQSSAQGGNWGFILLDGSDTVITSSDDTVVTDGLTVPKVYLERKKGLLSRSGKLFSPPVPIARSGWRIITFMPEDWVQTPFLRKRMAVFLVTVFSLGLALILIKLLGSAWAARQKAEYLRLQAQERNEDLLRHRETVKAANVGLWDYNLITGQIHLSPEWKHQIGYEDHELENNYETWESRIHPLDREATLKSVNDSIAMLNQNHEVEYRFRHKDGSYRWILSQATVVPDESGRPARIIGTHLDITGRKEIEERLKEGEARFRTVFEQAAAGVAVVDSGTGRFLQVNSRFCQMLGYSADELMAMKTIHDLTHPQDRQETCDRMTELLSGRIRDFAMEKRCLHRNGTVVWVNLTVSAAWNPGEPPGFHVSVVVDISERKRAEDEKQKMEAELIQARKMESIGTLAGGIAHDFNNILHIILGNANLSIDGLADSHPVYPYIKEIRSVASKGAGIVRHLLNFSRKSDQEFKAFNATETILESVRFIRSIIPVTIQFTTRICKDSIFIHGDPVQLGQIVINLCTNAFQAMEESGGEIEITVEHVTVPDLSNGSDCLRLAIRDTGPGIDRALLDRIFEPYFTTKAFGKGTGMGLAVVHGIVDNHHGRISVKSLPGEGACFEVTLPSIPAPDERNLSFADTIVSCGKRSILFVDDDISITRMMGKMLEKKGFQVKTSVNPENALELVLGNPERFDLVITDMTMPQMTGLALARGIKEKLPGMPVIICTGYSSSIDEESAADHFIDGFLMKPVALTDLLTLIGKVLSAAAERN